MVRQIRYPLDKETVEFIEMQRTKYIKEVRAKINKTQFSRLKIRPIIMRGFIIKNVK